MVCDLRVRAARFGPPAARVEDSDLDEAVQDLYDLRDHERWLAVENALHASNKPGIRKPYWLASAKRRRPITQQMFSVIEDRRTF